MGKKRANQPGYTQTRGKDGRIVWTPTNQPTAQITKDKLTAQTDLKQIDVPSQPRWVEEKVGPIRYDMSRSDMITALGKPNSQDDSSKTTMAWSVFTENGEGVHIYDYKQPNSDNVNWSFQGESEEAINEVIEWLTTNKPLTPPTASMNSASTTSNNSIETGSTIVMTGKHPTMSRAEMTQHLANSNITVASSISSKVDYLIAADPHGNSTKIQKAKQLGIPIVGYDKL